jgi:hypothetical protein
MQRKQIQPYFLLAATPLLPVLFRKQIMHMKSICLSVSDDKGASGASLPSSATKREHKPLEETRNLSMAANIAREKRASSERR